MGAVSGLVPMVVRMAGRFNGTVYAMQDREDIAQEGVVGLLEASARYEPGRGCSLATFGSRRAAGAMMDHVRVLARHAREYPAGDMSGGETRGLPFAPDPRSMESREMVLRFRRFLYREWQRLDGTEREVIEMRYFEGLTVRDVAARLGISPATATRVEHRALARLRERFLATRCGRD